MVILITFESEGLLIRPAYQYDMVLHKMNSFTSGNIGFCVA